MKKIVKVLLSLVTLSLLTLSIMPLVSSAETDKDIVETALGNEDFSILVSALQKAELCFYP